MTAPSSGSSPTSGSHVTDPETLGRSQCRLWAVRDAVSSVWLCLANCPWSLLLPRLSYLTWLLIL